MSDENFGHFFKLNININNHDFMQNDKRFHSSKMNTAESVSIGHPDFVASSIGDALLDAFKAQDENTHAGIEVLVTTNTVILAGEVTTKAEVDVDAIVRKTIKHIGYVNEEVLFDCCTVKITNLIHTQSPDINQGVSREDGEIGAGDQGIIFGFATRESEEYYPFDAQLANQLMRNYHAYQTKSENIHRFYPDAKAQVTFDETNNRVHTILLAISHSDALTEEQVREEVEKNILAPTLLQVTRKGIPASELVDEDTNFFINTTGKFVICGPHGDAGIMGRKIAVDQYGGHTRIGGGNLHGKDATKVDFSAAVGARHAAKNLVAAGVADTVEIQLAYAIGKAQPLSVAVNTFGTAKVDKSDAEIAAILAENYDFSPAGFIRNLKLNKVNRLATNTKFFFGVKPEGDAHTWEELDKVETFRKVFNL